MSARLDTKVENYTNTLAITRRQMSAPQIHHEKSSAQIYSRPSTAPQRLYRTYGKHVDQHHSMPTSAPCSPSVPSTRYIYYHYDEDMTKIHRQNCYIPTQHSVDVHNAFSPVHGPHTHIRSLLGPPPAPRPLTGIFHSAAFYHAPGRYPTPSKPFPPRRSQSRLSSSSHRKIPILVPFNSIAWDRNL